METEKSLTYRELLQILQDFRDEELDLDVSVQVDDEFRPLNVLLGRDYSGVLDDDHPYLIAK